MKYTEKELLHFKEILLNERNRIIESAMANRRSLVDDESGEYVGDNQTYASHMAEQGSDEMEREKKITCSFKETKNISVTLMKHY